MITWKTNGDVGGGDNIKMETSCEVTELTQVQVQLHILIQAVFILRILLPKS
jgi:hypothetical protein